MKTVLVTGANGFIGSRLCDELELRGHSVKRAVRRGQPPALMVGDIDGTTEWSELLAGTDLVVHLAGMAHTRAMSVGTDASDLRRVNVDGTRRLADQAVAAGVSRFVFVSSIGVHGDVTAEGSPPFSENSPPRPAGAYASSKWAAEGVLRGLDGGMELVIVRPPLVYGRDAPGNLARLTSLAKKKVPMPLANIANQRSLISVENLVDFLAFCVDVRLTVSPEVFVISDGIDISTTELVRVLFPRKRLVPVPRVVAQLGCRLLGQQRLYRQLWGSLTVDSRHARDDYGWKPPISLRDGLDRAVSR